MFKKILIANRGEIACRIIKTAKRLGIKTVAIYSEIDAHSAHVHQADETYLVGPAPAKDSYLNIEAIIQIALDHEVDAIHPGYGFLSENPHFAQAVQNAQLIFIGPHVEAMTTMGSKQRAKSALEHTSVPLIPGSHTRLQHMDDLVHAAKSIGFPLMVKAACGGGGKGMRQVDTEENLLAALHAVRREALAFFNDDWIILEKIIAPARHIEVQILADAYGHMVHLGTRECSIQRRHQKIIEEAPAMHLSAEQYESITQAALVVARSIQYTGAGTIEFLLDAQGQWYFLEMNTRLQVEHPVTEMITNLDLVEWQCRIAAHEPLSLTQDQIRFTGHAIEARIYAEDPRHDFLPSTGKIAWLNEGRSEHVRIDSGIRAHDVVSPYYDPMLSKMIAWGDTRAQALARLQQAITQYQIAGIATNRILVEGILQHPQFQTASYTTAFLSTHVIHLPPIQTERALRCAAAQDYLALGNTMDALRQDTCGFRILGAATWTMRYQIRDEVIAVRIIPRHAHQFILQQTDPESRELLITATSQGNTLVLQDGQQTQSIPCIKQASCFIVFTSSDPVMVERVGPQEHQDTPEQASGLTSPMPATVIAVLKAIGDHIAQGEAFIILDAMKMEHTILAPHAGIIENLFYAPGAQVTSGVTLAIITPRAD